MSASQKELRAAFALGAMNAWPGLGDRVIETMANRAFPPKPVMRPRVLVRKENRFRFVDGRLEYSDLVREWWRPLEDNDFHRQILDLMLNPTEVVEGED